MSLTPVYPQNAHCIRAASATVLAPFDRTATTPGVTARPSPIGICIAADSNNLKTVLSAPMLAIKLCFCLFLKHVCTRCDARVHDSVWTSHSNRPPQPEVQSSDAAAGPERSSVHLERGLCDPQSAPLLLSRTALPGWPVALLALLEPADWPTT